MTILRKTGWFVVDKHDREKWRVEVVPVARMINLIERRYLPRWRWDMKLWLFVLRTLSRWRFSWKHS